jgi:hypothetical protein
MTGPRAGRSRGVASILALGLLSLCAPAAAQSASDQAAAEALFKQGRDLMAAGRLSEACPKFAESQRLDPAAGTLLNLAACYEKGGQIASAWVTYKEAASAARKAGQEDRARMATGKVGELEPGLPTLTIAVPPSAEEAELQVRRDGELVGRAVWGAPIPVDPGPHLVEASAPGKKKWQAAPVVAVVGGRSSVEIPPLEPLPQPAPAAVSPAPVVVLQASEPPAPEHRGAGMRAAGLVIGGIGVAGLIAGGVLGALAISDNNDAKNACLGTVCPSQAFSSSEDAKHAATASTFGFVAGGALALAGVIVFVTAPRDHVQASTITPMIGPGAAGAMMRGVF